MKTCPKCAAEKKQLREAKEAIQQDFDEMLVELDLLREKLEKAEAFVGCGFCEWSCDRREEGWRDMLAEHLVSCPSHPLMEISEEITRLGGLVAEFREASKDGRLDGFTVKAIIDAHSIEQADHAKPPEPPEERKP